jgi:radical SAM protein with 4Fe4S-binding SPASM domain
MARDGVHVFCVTRYTSVVPAGREHLLDAERTLRVLDTLDRIERDFSQIYKEVKLPEPDPLLRTAPGVLGQVAEAEHPLPGRVWSLPYIPQGFVTPCPLSNYVIGNVRTAPCGALWEDAPWRRYEMLEHLPVHCRSCQELPGCQGGCVGYDDCLVAC